MERNTRSTKRKLVQATNENNYTSPKRGKAPKVGPNTIGTPECNLLPGTPKVNKAKKNLNSVGGKGKSRPTGKNNNTQVAEATDKANAQKSGMLTLDLNVINSPPQDEVVFKTAVRASEDEFMDDEPDQTEQGQSSNDDDSSGEEESGSDRSGSVVIAPIDKEEME